MKDDPTTRAGLIALISRRLGCDRACATALVDAIYAQMEAALLDGKPLRLSGIATLRVKAVTARRNLFPAEASSTVRSARIPRYRLTLRPSSTFRLQLASMNTASVEASYQTTAPLDTPAVHSQGALDIPLALPSETGLETS